MLFRINLIYKALLLINLSRKQTFLRMIQETSYFLVRMISLILMVLVWLIQKEIGKSLKLNLSGRKPVKPRSKENPCSNKRRDECGNHALSKTKLIKNNHPWKTSFGIVGASGKLVSPLFPETSFMNTISISSVSRRLWFLIVMTSFLISLIHTNNTYRNGYHPGGNQVASYVALTMIF